MIQVAQLNALITMLLGDLSSGDRQKIMTICTIDVHARDVVSKMITQKVESSQAFLWLSQLRHRWDEGEKDCLANICDAQFRYSHEYLGNTPRLVITPLTDRSADNTFEGNIFWNKMCNRLWSRQFCNDVEIVSVMRKADS